MKMLLVIFQSPLFELETEIDYDLGEVHDNF